MRLLLSRYVFEDVGGRGRLSGWIVKSGTDRRMIWTNMADYSFLKILEMDDDEEERDFSKSIVYDFFEQAGVTFKDMDKNL